MTNEEWISKTEGLKYKLALIQAEYSAGMEEIYKVAKALLAGEHFHALQPVMDALPIPAFRASLAELDEDLTALLASARPVSARPVKVAAVKEVAATVDPE